MAAAMEVDLDELTRNSLLTAYKEEVGVLFRELVLNMSAGNQTDEAVASYLRGVETVQRAFKIATA